MKNRVCFGMFAKYWSPGRVKTRLAQAIGNAVAAQVYRLFLTSQCQRLGGIEDSVLVYSPHERLDEFRDFLTSEGLDDDGWDLLPQAEGDLGQRMQEFFRVAFETGYESVVLVGSDTPTLPRSYVENAIKLLAVEDTEVVLGPTPDGGYYLIGAKGKAPRIFEEIAWSTPQVWDQTTTQLQSRRVPYAVLPQWYDVDDVDDLRHLMSELAGRDDVKISEPNDRLRMALQNILGPEFE